MLWEQIEKVLAKKNISAFQVAKEAGLSKNVLYEMKSGRTKDVKFSTMCKIADALDVSLDEFRPEKE